MYTAYIMRRTQIYLSDSQSRLLATRSSATGATVSQLIRDAIDVAYAKPKADRLAERLRIAKRTAGAWKDLDESGAAYVKRLRSGRRLSRQLRTS